MPSRDVKSYDTDCSLQCIAGRSKKKTVTQLLEIQSTQLGQKKSQEFLRNLECLYFIDSDENHRDRCEGAHAVFPTLRRGCIDATQDSAYVALSYTWKFSRFEVDRRKGSFRVESRITGLPQRSDIRDSVLLRMREYMRYVKVQYLWIDQECIDQQDASAQEEGMQVMDRVYSLSDYPVALLTRPIRSLAELQLLIWILDGRLIHQTSGRYSFSPQASKAQVREALNLLQRITSDLWFTRAWPFQENYRAGQNLRLLIPDPHKLNRRCWRELFGSLEGDLCIRSTDFHEQATKLCMAYRHHRLNHPACNEVLTRAGKYTISLQTIDQNGNRRAPQYMTPTILADLQARRIRVKWDYLAILGNCCQYSTRLNTKRLEKQKHSLSLSLLVLCLLNGEILANGSESEATAPGLLTITEYLKGELFNRFSPPSPTKLLFFNKGCRLVNPVLTQEGICTKGFVWNIYSVVLTHTFRKRPKRQIKTHLWADEASKERWRLRQLASYLGQSGRRDFAKQLCRYLYRTRNNSKPNTFTQKWQSDMASAVAKAIDRGKPIYVARSVNIQEPGFAFFILDREAQAGRAGPHFIRPRKRNTGDNDIEKLKHVFTAFNGKKTNSNALDFNDIDRHVSLTVVCPNIGRTNQRSIRLLTKGWINGLCFFEGCQLQPVVFPWPRVLRDL